MMMKRSLRVALFAVLVSATAIASGPTRKGAAEATFTGKGPAGFKLEGKTAELLLAAKGESVVISVPLGKLDTGIELRNQHMREKYLEVAKYPNAELQLARAAITLPAEGKSVEGKAKGTMTLHGKSQPVDFAYQIKREGNVYNVKGKVPLNLKAFAIDIPSYLGVTVKPDIETAVAFSFQE